MIRNSIILLLIPFLSIARNKDLPTDSIAKKVSFRGSVEMLGTTEQEILQKVTVWVTDFFSTCYDVTKIYRKDGEEIKAKGCTEFEPAAASEKSKFWAHYTIAIHIKNGGYDYQISDFYFQKKHPSHVSASDRINFDENDLKKYKSKDGRIKTAYQVYFSKAQELGNSLSASIKQIDTIVSQRIAGR